MYCRLEDHKIGNDEGVSYSYEDVFGYPFGISNCQICKLYEHICGGKSRIIEFFVYYLGHLLSVETHRRAATGNTKSLEVAGALAGTAPSSTARNSVTRPEVLWKTGRAT